MTIDLGRTARVAGVVTQSRRASIQRVETFSVENSTDGATWENVPGTLNGATSSSEAKVNALFPAAVSARYVKLIVKTWGGYHISMRAGVLECEAP